MQPDIISSSLQPACMTSDNQGYCATATSNARPSACTTHTSQPHTGANEPHGEVAGEPLAMPQAPLLGSSDTGTFDEWATPRLARISHPWESMPRDSDELGMPQLRVESPLSWPPLSTAERERKLQGLRELEAATTTGMWGLGLDHTGVWGSLDVAASGQSAWTADGLGRTAPPPQRMQRHTAGIGLGFDLALSDINSLSELQVALAFDRA